MRKDKSAAPLSFGSVSVIVVLLVMMLAAFAMLSYVNARADYALSEKTAYSVTAYYEADTKAEKMADRAAELIRAGDLARLSSEGYVYDGRYLSYSVPINEKTKLSVKLEWTGKDFRYIEWIAKSVEEQ